MATKHKSNPPKESHYRSLIKGISWRIIGTLDTMVLSLFVTGHTGQAMKIGLTEVLTKFVLYWLHERLWQRILINRELTQLLTVLKTISWRVTGTLDTLFISWFYTNKFEQGLSIAGLELVTKMALYYIHERVWLRIPKGTVRKYFKKKK